VSPPPPSSPPSSASAVELDGILRQFEAPVPSKPAKARSASEDVHVDLSVIVDRKPAAPAASEDPEKEYKRALALQKSGDVDKAIEAFERATRSPRLRFTSARAIGHMYRDRGQMEEAVDWLERASQAPTPTPEDSYEVLYELADALEAFGEVARALAVFIELQAEAGEYRDVDARVDRLTKVQAGG
jgi:tetratricopeptide (TPR) repeat protein